MKKLSIVVLLAFAVISGCDYGVDTYSNNRPAKYYALPDQLKDCISYRIMDKHEPNVTVFRCPNSTTTTMDDTKQHNTTVIIDGVEYVKK